MAQQSPEITDFTISRAVLAAWLFLYQLDSVTGVSAWLGPVSSLINRGYLALDGFFLLSGFTLAQAYRVHLHVRQLPRGGWGHTRWRNFLPHPGELRRFYLHRVARLFPVQVAVLALLALLVALGFTSDPQRFSASSFIQNLFLVQSWGWSDYATWNAPAWGLSALWAGSLVFPLLVFGAGYFEIVVAIPVLCITATVVGLVFTANHHSLNVVYGLGLYRFFAEFLAGILGRRIVEVIADVAWFRLLIWRLGLGLSLAGPLIHTDYVGVVGLWMVLFAFLMQYDTQLPALIPPRRWLLQLGRLAYGFTMSFAVADLVLSHYLGTPSGHPVAYGLGLLAGSAALGAALHFAIERPLYRFATARLAPAPEAS